MRDNSLLQKISEDLMGKKGAPQYPFILARRNEPQPLSYCLHDVGGWEGLEPTMVNGKKTWRIHHNFTLICNEGDMTCFIPDTPMNRAKLERLSQPTRDLKKIKRIHPISGKTEEFEQEIIIPSLYERIDRSLFENSALDELAERLEARIAERRQEKMNPPEPDDEDDEEVVRERNVGPRKIKSRRLKGGNALLDPIKRE